MPAPRGAGERNGDLPPPLFTAGEWRRIKRALRFSPRMGEIAELVVRTAQDKQIATELGISTCTIRRHFDQIFGRLNIGSRTELMYRVFATFRKEIEGKKPGQD
jgi:DNA-binding NarL/FixJ family response regulator